MTGSVRTNQAVFGPGLILGIGFGGFADGIALHQLLGWHHLLSARPQFSLRANDIADGVFHAAMWIILVAGVVWLYARLRQPPVPAAWPRPDAGPRPWRALVGPMLLGWGVFNVVEGLLGHQILNLHHVRPGPHQLAWDLAYLAGGVVLVGVSVVANRRDRRTTAESAG